ncbi:MAG: cupredoxin domain-containing protein [Anaerolineae bacterium]
MSKKFRQSQLVRWLLPLVLLLGLALAVAACAGAGGTSQQDISSLQQTVQQQAQEIEALKAQLQAAAYTPVTREFNIVTGEWKWEAEEGEAKVVDRERGEVDEIERYVFDPGYVVANKGDTIVMHIHAVKGSKHLIEIADFGVSETQINRGEEGTFTFTVDKTGVFEFVCNNHDTPDEEGPMIGYIYVNDVG